MTTAVCGEHFCDACGDCLHCYGEDPCYGSGSQAGHHVWPEVCENEDKGCKTTCCCGSDMHDHSSPMDCGHSPVSMHHWYCEGNCERECGRS